MNWFHWLLLHLAVAFVALIILFSILDYFNIIKGPL